MVTFVALLELAGIIWAVMAWGERRRVGHRIPGAPVGPPSTDSDAAGGTVAGWLIGHQIAHGKPGVPGDPLPGGHLGAPADLAYWGGMDEDEDEDEASDEW
jgi:hypothetical protein